MKRLTARQWATALVELTHEKKETEIGHNIKKFVQLLRVRRAGRQLGNIGRIYGELIDARQGVARVATTAARELPASVKRELENLATDVIIDHTIDPHVIGGMRIQMDGVIIDGTVATRLKKIYES